MYDLTTKSDTSLVDWNSDGNEPDMQLFSASGKLYSVLKSGDQLSIRRHDLDRGEIAETFVSYTVNDDADYSNWRFAGDSYAVFWVRQNSSSKEIELWKQDWQGDLPQLIYAFNEGVSPWDLDASGDVGAIEVYGDRAIVYNATTGASARYLPDGQVIRLQVYKVP